MSATDREKWDRRYAGEPDPEDFEPRDWIVELAPRLPSRGRALDVAGGVGRHALFLAARGLDTTLVDISAVGLALARDEARRRGLALATACVDLEHDPPPAGPWDLILVCYYLNRRFLAAVPELLAPGGLFVMVHPTRRNLERHEKPPAGFLLEEGELPELVRDLEVLEASERWQANDRHEARVVARRPPGRPDYSSLTL